MKLQLPCLILLPLLAMACSEASMGRRPILAAGNFVESGTKELSEDEIGTTPIEVPKQPPMTPEEKVSPPGNISGSYLICSELKAPTVFNHESTVRCGLRDQMTNGKVNISAGYASKLWTFEGDLPGTVTMKVSELNSSLEWHILISIKGGSVAEIEASRDSMKFYVTVQDMDGKKYQEATSVGPKFENWLALNGGSVPTNAAIGGSEDDGLGMLYICRVYVQGEVIPGKMILHGADPAKSICLSTIGNTTIQSQDADPNIMLYRSDVLQITDGVFDDYFEWLPGSDGLKPASAFAAGVDGLGNPLYSCRALQTDGAIPEQTLGVLRPGSGVCAYEYGVTLTSANYQVLSWKSTAMQKIFASQNAGQP